MAISVGDQLGPYKILSPLGKGGMGEVYRAHDSRLNRDVAIKVSSSQFSERFAREARSIAALNHTNICHLYDVGPAYLVMELVQGQELRGPLKFEEALPIIRQLIDGIEAAHDKNIIHRDLKPANIQVTPEGIVKILDFGLAKASEPLLTCEGNDANSPTLGLDETKAGVILGTAAYMAPEQAKGKTADKRSDIWSFGVIVYELLTGKRLFTGESAVDLLGKVINQDIDLSAAPVISHKLLRWCLEKDRKDRLQSIGDARRLLSEANISATISTPAKPLHKQPLVWLLASIAAFSLACALWVRPSVSSNSPIRLTITLPLGQEITSAPAISRDGRLIAYAAKQGPDEPQLYLRDLNSFEARLVPGTTGARMSFFSPDGKWIGFFAQSFLHKAEVSGGSPTRLAEAPYPLGGSWQEDDTIVYTPSLGSGLFKIQVSGSTPKQITNPDGAASGYAHVYPQVLPGGKQILYNTWGISQGSKIFSFETGKSELILPQKNLNAAFFISGRLLVNDDASGLRSALFNIAKPNQTSADTFLMPNVYSDIENESRPWMAVSDSGTAVLAPGNVAKTSLVWIDRQGKIAHALKEQGPYRESKLSPNGDRVVVRHGLDLWVHDLVRDSRTSLTAGSGNNMIPIWSSDGLRIIFASNRSGNWEVYSQTADGSKPAEVMFELRGNQFPCSILPDGTLIFREMKEASGTDLWVRTPNGKIEPLRVTNFNENVAQISPGPGPLWVAYASDESGRNEVFMQSFPSGQNRLAVSSGGGSLPRWSRDGRELFYLTGSSIVSVPIRPGGSLGAAQKILDLPDVFVNQRFQSYDVSPDGKRFLMHLREPGSVPRQLNIILNWNK